MANNKRLLFNSPVDYTRGWYGPVVCEGRSQSPGPTLSPCSRRLHWPPAVHHTVRTALLPRDPSTRVNTGQTPRPIHAMWRRGTHSQLWMVKHKWLLLQSLYESRGIEDNQGNTDLWGQFQKDPLNDPKHWKGHWLERWLASLCSFLKMLPKGVSKFKFLFRLKNFLEAGPWSISMWG